MKALIIYDSAFGNTELVAKAIGRAIGDDADVVHVGQAGSRLDGVDLLFVGSPTQGGRPTAAIKQFLAEIPEGGLKGVRIAAFDTRISAADSGFALKLLLRVLGFAAGRIEAALRARGGRPVSPVQGFIVQDKEGPLKEGELERAEQWAASLVTAAATA